MSPLLIVLLVLGAAAVLIASTALVSMLQRRDVMLRASEDVVVDPASIVLRPEKVESESVRDKLKARLEAWGKTQQENEELQHKLIQSGFESTTAPAIYFLARM